MRLCLILVWMCWSLAAQPLTGVVRARGRAVPGAVVSAKTGEKTVTTVSDEAGRFTLEDPGPGAVNLEVRMFGFQTLRQTLNETERKNTLAVDLTLRQGTTPLADLEELGQNGAAGGETANANGNDAVLVQGSVSRDFEHVNDRPFGGTGFDPAMLAALGVGPGGMGPQGGGAPGFGAGSGPGAGGPGQGPPGGGGFGGPGGGGFGPGMRGGGGPGGRGGPGGQGRPDFANMTPEQREQFRRQMQDRMARGGGPVQVVGNRGRRNGRDQIRGSVFYTEGNSALNAAPYSVSGQSLVKPDSDTKSFGFNLGGPMPGKVFANSNTSFFINYTGMRNNVATTAFGILPDDQQRAGNFAGISNIIYDPTNGTPFSANLIPSSRISTVAQGLEKLIPEVTQANLVENYAYVRSTQANTNTLSARLNHTIKRNRFALSFSWQNSNGSNVQPYGFIDPTQGSGRNIVLTWSRNFTPRFIANLSARYNLNYTQTVPYFANLENISSELGIQGNSQAPINWGPPNLTFTNFLSLNDAAAYRRNTETYQYSGGIYRMMGKHAVRAGGDFMRLHWNTYNDPNPRGNLLFGGLFTSALTPSGAPIPGTGWDFADFLLGYTQQSTLRYGSPDSYMRQSNYDAFVTDEWRVMPNLTINLGLRYELYLPFTEKYDRLANLAIAPGFTAVTVVTPGAANPYGSGTIPDGLVYPDKTRFSPRTGIAWRPWKDKRTLFRAGYSIINDSTVLARVARNLVDQPPFATTATLEGTEASPLTLTNPFNAPPNVNVKNTYAFDPNLRIPYAQTWNVLLEQPLPHALTLDLSYIGTKGTGLIISEIPNRAPPGSALTADQRRLIADASGFTYDSTQGDSIYHAGQIRLTKRQTRGFTWNVSYIYSKSIDNATALGGVQGLNVTVQNPNDLAAERGLSSFDHRHVLTSTAMATSPFGPQGYFLRDASKRSLFLREWNLTSSITYQTGAPLTALISGAIADPTGSGAVGSGRAEATGLPINAGTGYFNTAAFTIPPPGQYGDAGRNTIPGPPMFSWNASFGRGFVMHEGSRYRLDVRASANNILNHVNIAGFGTTVNAANYGLATSAAAMRSVTLTARFRF